MKQKPSSAPTRKRTSVLDRLPALLQKTPDLPQQVHLSKSDRAVWEEIFHRGSWTPTEEAESTRKKPMPFTRLDLDSLRHAEYGEFLSIVRQELGVSSRNQHDSDTTIMALNTLYRKNLDLIVKTLYLKVPTVLSTLGQGEWEFSSIDDFAETMYMLAHENHGYSSLIACALLKSMSVVKDLIDNPDIATLDEDMEEAFERMKWLPNLSLRKLSREKKGGDTTYYQFTISTGKWPYMPTTPIHGRLVFRNKSEESIYLKLISNPEYYSLSKFRDLLGFRMELDMDDDETKVAAINYFAYHFYNRKSRVTYAQKDGFLSEASRKFFGKSIRVGDLEAKKESNDASFQDGKLKGEVLVEASGGRERSQFVEMQFVTVNNKNESGFSRHEIYKIRGRLSALCRATMFVTSSQLRVAIDDMHQTTGIHPRKIMQELFVTKKEPNKELDASHYGFLIPIKSRGAHQLFTVADIERHRQGDIHEIYDDYPEVADMSLLEFEKLMEMPAGKMARYHQVITSILGKGTT